MEDKIIGSAIDGLELHSRSLKDVLGSQISLPVYLSLPPSSFPLYWMHSHTDFSFFITRGLSAILQIQWSREMPFVPVCPSEILSLILSWQSEVTHPTLSQSLAQEIITHPCELKSMVTTWEGSKAKDLLEKKRSRCGDGKHRCTVQCPLETVKSFPSPRQPWLHCHS